MARASTSYESVKKVIEISKRDNISTSKAADRMAEERIEKLGKIKAIYLKK